MSRTTVVVGACGGCGASMVAGALALWWARDARVWLIELDLERGDRAGAWDLPSERTLDDLAAVAEEIDAGHLGRAVQEHPSGVRVILAGGGTAAAGAWNGASLGRLLEASGSGDEARSRTVLDSGPGWELVTRLAAERALNLVLVCPPTLSGARRARRLLGTLTASGADSGCGLVINQGSNPEEIGARAFGRAVGAPVLAELPWATRDAAHLSAGRWPDGRRSRLGDALAELARVVA